MSSVRSVSIAIALTAGITACSSAPNAERTSATREAIDRCYQISDCDGPYPSPPPPPPSGDDDDGAGGVACWVDHPACNVFYSSEVTPDFASAGCVAQGRYSSGEPKKRTVDFAYCHGGPDWAQFEANASSHYLFHYVRSDICDSCLPPVAPGYFYFFYVPFPQPLCEGGCPQLPTIDDFPFAPLPSP